MKPVQFLSNSSKIDNIVKGLTLTKSLFVSSLLIGEKHTGKKTLIKTLFPNTTYIDAKNSNELISALAYHDEIIIYNFEQINNFDNLNFENKRVIAIANHLESSKKIESKFAFIYTMPPLNQREDLTMLLNHFKEQIAKELLINLNIDIDKEKLDFSQNLKSLKASMYKQLIKKTFDKNDLEELLFEYLLENINGNNAYRENLELYERPLIQAGLQKYKSQLKLSNILGLNRNTLRKKIQEHGLD